MAAAVSRSTTSGQGIRGTHPLDIFGQQMRPVAAAMLMSHEDAVDVAAYIGTLRGGESTESARNSDSARLANGAARADGR